MKNITRIFVILCLPLAAMLSTQAQGAIVTFDALETATGPSFQSFANPLEIEGFRFLAVSGTGGPRPISPRQGAFFYNGSAGLSSSNTGDIVMTKLGGGSFDVFSVDVDQYFTLGSSGFEFRGVTRRGELIVQQFVADTVRGNQSVNLIGFLDLSLLRFTGIGSLRLANIGTIDNIATTPVNPVPVPASIWLFATALFALTGIKRRMQAV